jgi:hypothetical protein
MNFHTYIEQPSGKGIIVVPTKHALRETGTDVGTHSEHTHVGKDEVLE